MDGKFLRAFPIVIAVEGELSLDQWDRGNWTGGRVGSGDLKGTKYGITAMNYPDLDIPNLTLEQAREIYWHDYWGKFHCNQMPWPLCLFYFDGVVNQDRLDVNQALQRALGVKVDGIVGPITLGAARKSTVYHAQIFLVYRLRAYATYANYDVAGLGWWRRIIAIAMESNV